MRLQNYYFLPTFAKEIILKTIMKTYVLTLIAAAGLALGVASCGGNSSERQAAKWLEQAQTLSDKGEYAQAMAAIDSLRKKYPKAIETRQSALKLYQEVNIKLAQQTVEQADRALQAANGEYEKMNVAVNELKEKGEATAEQLTNLTLLRMKRDSLKTVFDVECAKIKYIRAKMKE